MGMAHFMGVLGHCSRRRLHIHKDPLNPAQSSVTLNAECSEAAAVAAAVRRELGLGRWGLVVVGGGGLLDGAAWGGESTGESTGENEEEDCVAVLEEEDVAVLEDGEELARRDSEYNLHPRAPNTTAGVGCE
jgi:hypothetical protein